MSVQKKPTGIDGLDHLLKGGVLPNASIMVEGTPGTGKSTLALQFIAEGVRLGEPGIFVTLEEYPSEFYRDARSYGWDFTKWEQEGKVRVIATSAQALKKQIETGGPLTAEARSMGARRVVVDSVNHFERVSTNPIVLRSTLGGLIHAFKIEDMISLFTKDTEAPGALEVWGRYTVDILIELSFLLMKGRERHRLIEVHKARGQDHVLGRHTFKITDRGGMILPRPVVQTLVAAKEGRPKAERIPSGTEGFDEMLGGGLIQGQTVLLAGGAGTGKSLLAASFAQASGKSGRSLYICMEDPPGRVMQNAAAIGVDLFGGVKSGDIKLLYLPPVELSPDELLHLVETELDAGGYHRLVIDSISSLRSVTPEPEYLHDVIRALAMNCFSRDVVGLFTAEIEEVTGPFRFTDFGGSFIADTVILLRLVEVSGELKKAISVIKARGTSHDPTLRELVFTPRGLKVGAPFENLAGLLTGVPTAQRPVAFEAYFGEVSPEQQRIASILGERKEATVQEVADAAGMNADRARELLEALAESGFVTAVEAYGEIRYRPTLMRPR